MQFSSDHAEYVNVSYDEPCASTAQQLSPVSSQSRQDGVAVVHCTPRRGLAFSAELSAEDVMTSVLESLDVELIPMLPCLAGELNWVFKCAASDLEHILDEEVVVKQQIVLFKLNLEEVAEPQLAHVWYASSEGKDIPSAVTAALIVSNVKNRANIDLVPVPVGSEDALGARFAPGTAFEFLCQPSAVLALQGDLTARITVKRCALRLDVGDLAHLPTPPPLAHHGGAPQRSLPGAQLAEVAIVHASPEPDAATMAAREEQVFDLLREAHMAATASPTGAPLFADNLLNALYVHFSYEYK